MLPSLLKQDYVQFDASSDRDPYAPAEFVRGWFTGITPSRSVDFYGDIMKCYKTNIVLTNALYDAMEAYVDGDFATGDAEM